MLENQNTLIHFIMNLVMPIALCFNTSIHTPTSNTFYTHYTGLHIYLHTERLVPVHLKLAVQPSFIPRCTTERFTILPTFRRGYNLILLHHFMDTYLHTYHERLVSYIKKFAVQPPFTFHIRNLHKLFMSHIHIQVRYFTYRYCWIRARSKSVTLHISVHGYIILRYIYLSGV